MPKRVLFIAALHHPEQLVAEINAGTSPPPIFPSSMEHHFYERAMRAAGYELDIFWRNLPGYGSRDIRRLRTAVFRQGLTPRKIATGLLNRMPPRLHPDYRRRNQLLLEKARLFKPDLVWMPGGNREIYPETLLQLKAEHNCPIIYVYGDSPVVFSNANERAAARLYDLVLVNDLYHGMQWRELGAPRMACLPFVGIDPDFHFPQPLTDVPNKFLCDIGFVGTLVPDHLYSERVAALESLRDFDLGIWSMHEAPPSLKPFYRGSAIGKDMLRVLASVKISLNVHGDFMRYGGNMRLFESAAVGAFQLVDDRPGVHQLFTPGEHLVIYSDHEDLRAKARYYLDHDEERRRIAEKARMHALAVHSYEGRLERLEEILAGN